MLVGRKGLTTPLTIETQYTLATNVSGSLRKLIIILHDDTTAEPTKQATKQRVDGQMLEIMMMR